MNNSVFYLGLLLFLSQFTFAQSEQAFLHTDKKICYPGDTVWFRGHLFRDSVPISSTNFYVELYDDTARLITRNIFPVIDGTSFGQIEVPQQPGSYWLRGYTLNSSTIAIQPLTVRDTGSQVVARKLLVSSNLTPASTPPVQLLKDENGYIIAVKDSIAFNYSLAVVNINDPGDTVMSSVKSPKVITNTNTPDTSHISFSAAVEGLSGPTGKQDVVMIFQQDSITLPPQLVPVDSAGNVSFSNLFFFDTAYIYYKLNTPKTAKKSSIQLVPFPKAYPAFTPLPFRIYRTDTFRIPLVPDTAFTNTSWGKLKQLKTVVVKGRWIDRNRALDKRYVISPEFAPVEHYTFDIRDASIAKRFFSVYDFLKSELPHSWVQSSIYWPECKNGVQFYIDEQPVTGLVVDKEPIRKFAYIKIFQDMHPPCPAVCIYTRKGEDLKVLPTQMNTLAIKGYDKPLQWQSADRTTLLWDPYVSTNTYRFNVPAKSFKVIVIGVTNSGSTFNFEKVVY